MPASAGTEHLPGGAATWRRAPHQLTWPARTADPRSIVGPGLTSCDCITCGDVALPLTVERVDEARGLALCRSEAGETETVEIGLVDPVQTGDVLLVHAGTAIARAAA